jgi:hypothetical protein
MEVAYPKYPFIWNYDDMYDIIESQITDYVEGTDSNVEKIKEKFFNYSVVVNEQKIKTDNVLNFNVHTYYLSEKNVFNVDENSIIISSDSTLNYAEEVPVVVYDPNKVFDRSIYNFHDKKNRLTIFTNLDNITRNNLYIRTHNIDGIFRFSPKNNSRIKFYDYIKNPIFYTILDNTIVVNKIEN